MGQEAVIYCRASQDRTGAGLSVTGQEADCRQFCAEHNLTVAAVFTDNDITASGRKRRPGYQDMLTWLTSRPGTVVVTWHTDRLHRNMAELERYITIADEHHIITRTVQAGELDLATASGRMVARVVGATARHELEHMSERRKAAKARAAAAGQWNAGGPRIFGWRPGGTAIVPAEAGLIMAGTAAILAGRPLLAVTRDWNASGIRPPRGAGQWMPREVSAILRRPRNAGLVLHRKRLLEGVAGRWTPIVDEADWRACRAILNDPARRTQTGTQPRWLLSGLALCCACGQPMIVSRAGGQGREPRKVYKCRTPGGGHVARDAQRLDEYVSELVIARLSRPDAAQLVQPRVPASGEAAALQAGITSARQRLDQAAELFAAGDIDAAQLATITSRLSAEIENRASRLASLAERDALAVFAAGSDPRAAWEGLDLYQRRAVVRVLLTVTVLPAPRGRPRNWRAGQPYFDENSVRIDWHR